MWALFSIFRDFRDFWPIFEVFGQTLRYDISAATGYFSTKPPPFERARRVEKLLLFEKSIWGNPGGARARRKSMILPKNRKIMIFEVFLLILDFRCDLRSPNVAQNLFFEK